MIMVMVRLKTLLHFLRLLIDKVRFFSFLKFYNLKIQNHRSRLKVVKSIHSTKRNPRKRINSTAILAKVGNFSGYFGTEQAERSCQRKLGCVVAVESDLYFVQKFEPQRTAVQCHSRTAVLYHSSKTATIRQCAFQAPKTHWRACLMCSLEIP
jgi:hypothetical protein